MALASTPCPSASHSFLQAGCNCTPDPSVPTAEQPGGRRRAGRRAHQSGGGAPAGKDRLGGGAGRVPDATAGPGRPARGRRRGRASSRVAEPRRRCSLPSGGPAVSGGRAEGRAGRRSVWEAAYPVSPMRRSGLRVGCGPGRRQGTPSKSLGRADETGGPDCGIRFVADSVVAGTRGGSSAALRCPESFSSHLVGEVRIPWAVLLQVDPRVDC